ncbi:MAG: SDR family oxidoreductase [Caldilineaceae bacterium]
MQLLILGGTVFLGRHLVEAALERGHTVTLFNRGQHNPDLFPEVEKLRGDRDGQLDALRNRQWDAVIDTCGYIPRAVRASAELLADQVDQYVFISTISVYPDYSRAGIDESEPVGVLDDPTVEEVTGETYGPLKALCEAAAEDALPSRALIIRPGLIVGPHDPTDRFTYWPARVAAGGAVLAPGDPQQRVQVIDVRDLAAWTIHMVEIGQNGVYNATGPAQPLSMQSFLAECKAVSQSDAQLTWVDEAFLVEQEVGAFVELPLWVPAAMAGLEQVNCAKAMAAGLTYRPLSTTIRDTLAWHATRPEPITWRAGLRAEKENALLEKWRLHTTV